MTGRNPGGTRDAATLNGLSLFRSLALFHTIPLSRERLTVDSASASARQQQLTAAGHFQLQVGLTGLSLRLGLSQAAGPPR